MSETSVQVEVPDEAYWRGQIKCQDACPVNTDARGYVRAIAEGDFEKAYLIARGPNPLASICGRVCGAPCEAACRRGDIDQAVSIRGLKRFVTEQFGTESGRFKPLEILQRVLNSASGRECSADEELIGLRRLMRDIESPPEDGPKVAIIGSGPAGLAAAHDLALLGCRPVVFEMEPVPAGMLAVGIPEYRLPRDLIRAEVEVIEALGVEFRCNIEIGKDITFEDIRKEFEATIIAVGAKKSFKLDIPGAQGQDVLGGIEFLRDVALDKPVELGKRVVVLGGGNVAYDVSRSVIRQAGVDVSRTALRQAAVGEVHMISLESLEELPADNTEIIEGDEEGVIRHHRLGPTEILRDEQGDVTGIKCRQVTRVFDDDGNFSPAYNDDETTVIDADTIIWSIGQRVDLEFMSETNDVQRNQRGLIECNQNDMTTSAPDVFLAGDVAYGPRLLIDAVASGKQSARTVYRYLTGKQVEAQQVVMHLPILDYKREADYEKQPRVSIPALSAKERIKAQNTIVETGYSQDAAFCEAGRCLDCGVNTIFDSDKCILCGGCADVCPENCLRLVSVSSLVGANGFDDLIDARYGEDDEEGSAIIKDESNCIRCALCAVRCPVDAITMERITFAGTWETVSS